MPLDYQTLETLRKNHPAWRFLASPHAPLMASFFQKVFIEKNVRIISQADLVEALDDVLFNLCDTYGPNTFPKSATGYLNDWAGPEKGWLRKFYRKGSDDVQFDLTPATEKAISWLEGLGQRSFVGTESRLLMLFDLLQQLSEGSEESPEARLKDLYKRREAIDAEIAQVQMGNVALLDDTAVKDRFMQFTQQARELLSDFREVEHNFRQLDRNVRERIATWEGKKGELLGEIMGERDAIADSDQGASFRAFWDFLMSRQRQEEFSERLDKVLDMPSVQSLKPEKRTRRIHHDWLEAGEFTQRTVAQLSQQLRRFLDDQAWLENKRIMEILHGIESKALKHRQALSQVGLNEIFTEIDALSADIELPMERPLYNPPAKVKIANIELKLGEEDVDSSALYSQVVVDKAALASHVRQALQQKSQVTLSELCLTRPLHQGLAELVAYLELGEERSGGRRFSLIVDEENEEQIIWLGADGRDRLARMPRVIFLHFDTKSNPLKQG